MLELAQLRPSAGDNAPTSHALTPAAARAQQEGTAAGAHSIALVHIRAADLVALRHVLGRLAHGDAGVRIAVPAPKALVLVLGPRAREAWRIDSTTTQ
jgi:hypothetical protein